MLRRNSLVRKGPSESRHRIVPFHRPSITDNMASIGQADNSFFDTGIFLPCTLTYLSAHLSVSVYAHRASKIQERKMNLLNVATTLCIGLLIGAEFAVSAFVNPVLFKLSLAARAEATRFFGRLLGTAMPFWYIASLLLLLSETILHLHKPLIVWLGVAVAFWCAAIALSLVSLVPINNRLVRMGTDGWSESAQREQRKWDDLHRVRVLFLGVAMVFFLAGIGI
jgi:hypothetical protein